MENFIIHHSLNESILLCSYSGILFGRNKVIFGFLRFIPDENDALNQVDECIIRMIPPGFDILGYLGSDNNDNFVNAVNKEKLPIFCRDAKKLTVRNVDDSDVKDVLVTQNLELDTHRICVLHLCCSFYSNLLGKDINLVDILQYLDKIKVRFESGYTIEILDTLGASNDITLQDCISGFLPDLASEGISYSAPETTTSSKSKGSSKKGKKSATKPKKTTASFKLPNIKTEADMRSWGSIYHLDLISSSPLVNLNPIISNGYNQITPIDLDMLCYCNLDDSVHSAMAVVHSGLRNLLTSQFHLLRSEMTSSEQTPPALMNHQYRIRSYHYLSSPLCAPITISHVLSRPRAAAANSATVIETSLSDNSPSGANYRRRLHVHFGLPLDRPLLKLSCALDVSRPTVTDEERTSSAAGKVGNGRLLCVHEGLGESGVRGGRKYLVQGPYAYYHYMQVKKE